MSHAHGATISPHAGRLARCGVNLKHDVVRGGVRFAVGSVDLNHPFDFDRIAAIMVIALPSQVESPSWPFAIAQSGAVAQTCDVNSLMGRVEHGHVASGPRLHVHSCHLQGDSLKEDAQTGRYIAECLVDARLEQLLDEPRDGV